MVLNKSKWDHKAKIQYLKKHGLTRPKQKAEITPKWSSKKSSKKSTITLDSDSEWDSEDEDLINHFFPELSPQELPEDYKRKLKQQIHNALAAREGADTEDEGKGGKDSQYEENDGIYLGTRPVDVADGDESDQGSFEDEDEFEFEIPDLEAKLSDFLILSKPHKSRKLLKNKMLDNFLEEYGIESLQSTVKNVDYNDVLKLKEKDFEKLDPSKLNGFRIGDSLNKPKASSVRILSKAEQQEHKDREEKREHARFYNQIKSTFGQQPEKANARILEINNLNENDEAQLELLNMRINRNGQMASAGNEDDLDDLLGLSKDESSIPRQTDLDTLMLQSRSAGKSSTQPTIKKVQPKSLGLDALLDDLLGI